MSDEKAKIDAYIDVVCEKLKWRLYEDESVTDTVKAGLVKNREKYGFQACPCYSFLSYHERSEDGVVVTDAKGTPKKNIKVNCPCEPARKLDVPGSVTYPDRATMEKETKGWPDRGEIVENLDGSITLNSHHPGYCHCFLFTNKEAT